MICKQLFSRVYIIIVFGIILLSGCSSYQYMSVNSYLEQNESQEFIFENDTIQLKYSFPGENLQITILLFNKLRQPLYLDLERSTVVINNYQVENPFDPEGQVNFIAPLSYAKIISYPLSDQMIKLNPKDSLIEKTTLNNVGRIYSYNEETTPLYFRIILAITANDDYSSPTFFDYSFWVSDILQTSTGPKSMKYNPSNQFYVGKTTGFGKVLGWTGVILLLFLSALLLAAPQ